mmetsp:Transcript_14747/g.44045  ORF Transcript_14747/g.44045 Transcript_14747/m.44045 type:complete len:137 (+) Transcript_14747:140-550(+)
MARPPRAVSCSSSTNCTPTPQYQSRDAPRAAGHTGLIKSLLARPLQATRRAARRLISPPGTPHTPPALEGSMSLHRSQHGAPRLVHHIRREVPLIPVGGLPEGLPLRRVLLVLRIWLLPLELQRLARRDIRSEKLL